MIETVVEEGGDRIIIKLDPGGPVELTDLTESFAALARLYERHHRPEGHAPKLYVTRLETGSVVAEIVPYAAIMGAAIYTMDGAVIVADFTRRLWAGIRAFADPAGQDKAAAGLSPTREDAKDIREFVKPLAGKPGASLGIIHARLEKDARHMVVEYDFDEAAINRATVNIDQALESDDFDKALMMDSDEPEAVEGPILNEVMLFFEQASTKPGKEKGRTGDRGIVPEVSSKGLPVYFRKSFQNLKEQMVKGEINPLTHTFVVDVHVQRVDGEPKGYIVTDVHQIIPMDDSDGS